MCVCLCMPLYEIVSVQHTRMHISKTRQLRGLLDFCLLSGAESEMERIDLLSAGGALPWVAPAHLLGCYALPTHSLPIHFYFLSAWRLPLLQLTLVVLLLGELGAELLTPELIFPFFPISCISNSWRLWKRQTVNEGRR